MPCGITVLSPPSDISHLKANEILQESVCILVEA